MKKILIVGLPGTGVTLITKMLAKELSKRGSVVIKDSSVTGRTFESFVLNDLDETVGVVDYDGIDIVRNSVELSTYDFCITEATIAETEMSKDEIKSFDKVIVIANGNMQRKLRTERFIKDNKLRNIILIVNLSYIGEMDYADGFVDYVAFIGMDSGIQATDAKGEKKGKIMLSKMPKDFRKQVTALAMEVVPEEEKKDRLWPVLIKDKSHKKGDSVNV